MAKEEKNKSKQPDTIPEKIIPEIVEQLKNLRTAQKNIIERYRSNLEGDIAWCIDNLSLDGQAEKPKVLSNQKALTRLLESLQDLKLKPHKGRLKDIRKIDDLVNDIYAKLID